jgi:hypothetical protein
LSCLTALLKFKPLGLKDFMRILFLSILFYQLVDLYMYLTYKFLVLSLLQRNYLAARGLYYEWIPGFDNVITNFNYLSAEVLHFLKAEL